MNHKFWLEKITQVKNDLIKIMMFNIRPFLILFFLVIISWAYQDYLLADHLAKYAPDNSAYYIHVNWPWGENNSAVREFLSKNQLGFDRILGEQNFVLRPDFLTLVDRELAIAAWSSDFDKVVKVVLVKIKDSESFLAWTAAHNLAADKLNSNVYAVYSTDRPTLVASGFGQKSAAQTVRFACAAGSQLCLLVDPNQTITQDALAPLLTKLGLSQNFLTDGPLVFSVKETAQSLAWQANQKFAGQGSYNGRLGNLAAALPADTAAAIFNLPLNSLFNGNLTWLKPVGGQAELLNDSNLFFWRKGLINDYSFLVLPNRNGLAAELKNRVTQSAGARWPVERSKTLPDGSRYVEYAIDAASYQFKQETFNNQELFWLKLPDQQEVVIWQKADLLWLSNSLVGVKEHLGSQNKQTYNLASRLGLGGFYGQVGGMFIGRDLLSSLGLVGFNELILNSKGSKISGFIR